MAINTTNTPPPGPLAESENRQGGYEISWTPENPPPADLPPNLLSNMVIPQNGYLVNHLTPTDNIIIRNVPNPIFDLSDVLELGSNIIYELLPKAPVYPQAPPVNLEAYVANWSRVYNYGGITDKAKDPRLTSVSDWTIGNWAKVHKWPEVSTLDPTYIFFTQDPALFYTQRVISHYEPDSDDNMIPVMVPDDSIVWKLNGKEVHRGWYMDLSALSRTVEIRGGEAAIAPNIITIEAENDAGVTRKEIKYAVIDSEHAGLVDGANEVDNFTSTFTGQFIADEDASSENYRSAVFWPDPRYGPRDVYVRFKFSSFAEGKSKRRKFRNNNAKFTIDGQTIFDISGTQVYDRWQNKDTEALRHQDAIGAFPEMFDDVGRIKEALRNTGGSGLSSYNVTDWTDGRPSALFCDEPSFGFSRLIKFQKKPGPFTLEMYLDFRIRIRKQGKKTRYWDKKMMYTNDQLHLDIPLQPIDLGVVEIPYDHKD